jgi:23S rRNA G2445 N2-methylase RlmL
VSAEDDHRRMVAMSQEFVRTMEELFPRDGVVVVTHQDRTRRTDLHANVQAESADRMLQHAQQLLRTQTPQKLLFAEQPASRRPN